MESMGVRKKDKNLEVSSLAKKEAELQSLKEEERQLIEEERKQDKQIGE